MKITRSQLRKLIVESLELELQYCLDQMLSNAYQRDEMGERLPHSAVENYLWHEVYHSPHCDFLDAFPQGGEAAIEFQRKIVNAFGYTWEEYVQLSREKTARIEAEILAAIDTE